MRSIARNVSTARTCGELLARIVQKRDPVETSRYFMDRAKHLGPTYIKIGQFVSLRKDVVGDDVADVLAGLRDSVNPLPFDVVQSVVRRNGIFESFDEIDPAPLASASIAQVHSARIDGIDVVIKVKRPDLERQVAEDIDQLRWLISVASSIPMVPKDTVARLNSILSEFELYLQEEMDFFQEMKNAKRFQKMYRNDPSVVVPEIFDSLSSRDIIVMQFLPSSKIEKYAGDRVRLSQKIMRLFVSQLLYEGVVHGDPHTGNIGIDKEGRIVMYDFGSTIRVDRDYRTRLKLVISCLIGGNPKEMVKALRNLGIRIVDSKSAESYMALYYKYVRTIDVNVFRPADPSMAGSMDVNSVDTIRPNPDAVPFEFDDTLIRLFRVFGMLEGICKELNDDFDYFDIMTNFWDAFLLDEDFVRTKGAWDVSKSSTQSASGAPKSSFSKKKRKWRKCF